MTALFDVNNRFTVVKVDGSTKIINFNTMQLVEIYYAIKRLSNDKHKHKYDLNNCFISRPAEPTCVLKSGYKNILYTIEEELNKQYKFNLVLHDGDRSIKFWHNTTAEILRRLKQLKEKTNDPDKSVWLHDHETNNTIWRSLSTMIRLYEDSPVIPSVPYTKETVLFPDVDSTGMDIRLDFNAVLQELTPAISKGTDQEKRDAKVILAYLAKKLVEQ